jgi:hypothetical protein
MRKIFNDVEKKGDSGTPLSNNFIFSATEISEL